MDSITHAAVGACIGEAMLGKKLGRKAMLWGALAQSAPDIDFVASFWMTTTSDLLAHRGFAHSILFGIIATIFLSLLAERWHRPHNIKMKTYLLFFAIEIFMHLFLDGLNNYGVGWLEPFSHKRFSLNVIYVADPFFSLGPAIATIVLLLLKGKTPVRRFWWQFTLITSGAYLVYCFTNKFIIDQDTRKSLAHKKISYDKYFTTPTVFNNWLWYIVAGNDSGFYIGHRSVFDTKRETFFRYFPKNDTLLETVDDKEGLQKLIRFSQGYYTVEKWHDTLIFNDLRFGQIAGWTYPDEHFVFHYFLTLPDENTLVVQRGRIAKWDKKVVKSMLSRIRGN